MRALPLLLLLGLLATGPLARAGSTTDQPVAPPPTVGRGKIGAMIGLSSSGSAMVTQILPGTPAERAGLQPYDQILKVDGQLISKLSLTEAIARITGLPGTRVTLLVERGGQRQEVYLTREALGGVLNDVLRDRKVARIARFLLKAQGGAAVAAIAAVHLEARIDGVRTQYLDASRGGFRNLTCSESGLVRVFGHDGRRSWGLASPGVAADEEARELMERPARALPNLIAAELEDPDRTVSYKGTVPLVQPAGLPFKIPRRAHRFEVGGISYDFDPRSGMLVHQLDATGYPIFFGDYRRVGKIAVPGKRTIGRSIIRIERVSFAPIPASRFRSRGTLHCDP